MAGGVNEPKKPASELFCLEVLNLSSSVLNHEWSHWSPMLDKLRWYSLRLVLSLMRGFGFENSPTQI